MVSRTRELAAFIASSELANLPDAVVNEAQREILDIIGCAIGGYLSEIGSITIDLVHDLGGKPECTVIGSGDKTSVVNATYANARMANAIDADDTFEYITIGHFAQAAVAASLAICERQGSSGGELITSVTAGFETAARVGIAIGPPTVEERGKRQYARHFGGGTSMVIAAAAAAARALKLDQEQTYHTLCIAGANIPVPTARRWSEIPGPLPLFKYADAGWCAQAGLMAALLAQKGTTGLPDIFDGDNSVLVSLGADADHSDFDAMVRQLGTKWYLPETSYKPWPSCRLTHQPLTAFTRIMDENHLTWQDIEKVTIGGSGVGASPRFRNPDPIGMISCEFNHPHAITMAAMGIDLPLWYAEDVLNDPRVKEFRRRVVIEEQPSVMNSDKPDQLTGLFSPPFVRVKARGQVFESKAANAKGDPWSAETYFSNEELEGKFGKLALPLNPSVAWSSRIDRIIKLVWQLRHLDDVHVLAGIMFPAEE